MMWHDSSGIYFLANQIYKTQSQKKKEEKTDKKRNG